MYGGAEIDDIYVSHSSEDPLSWSDSLTHSLLSCGLFQDYDDSGDDDFFETNDIPDWGTIVWTLSGMEFLRLSFSQPETLESDSAVARGVWL